VAERIENFTDFEFPRTLRIVVVVVVVVVVRTVVVVVIICSFIDG
jgi:hypothetical protein